MKGNGLRAVPSSPPMKTQLRSLWHRIPRAAERLRHIEFRVLLLLLCGTLAIWGFAGIADEVMEGDTRAFDEAVLLAMRMPGDAADPRGPRWLEEAARDITGLGGVTVLGFVTLAAAAYLCLRGKTRTMWFLLIAVGSGILLGLLMKQWFDRPRPDLVPHGSYVYTASFPSGHSMMSALTYLTLAALLARVERRRAIRAYLLFLAVLLTILIGTSRVYLGVHWPTDVLAGWAAGAAWALLCWIVARFLERRGSIETAPDAGTPPSDSANAPEPRRSTP